MNCLAFLHSGLYLNCFNVKTKINLIIFQFSLFSQNIFIFMHHVTEMAENIKSKNTFSCRYSHISLVLHKQNLTYICTSERGAAATKLWCQRKFLVGQHLQIKVRDRCKLIFQIWQNIRGSPKVRESLPSYYLYTDTQKIPFRNSQRKTPVLVNNFFLISLK